MFTSFSRFRLSHKPVPILNLSSSSGRNVTSNQTNISTFKTLRSVGPKNVFRLKKGQFNTNHSQFFVHTHFVLINSDAACGSSFINSPKFTFAFKGLQTSFPWIFITITRQIKNSCFSMFEHLFFYMLLILNFSQTFSAILLTSQVTR